MMNEGQITRALAKYVGDQVFFMPQVKTGSTWFDPNLRIVDAISIKKSWKNPCITIYEIKTNRQDFVRDEKWPNYLKYCHRFYFVCPKGLIERDELTQGVGLITVNDNGGARTVKACSYRHLEQLPYDLFYYIILSRLGSERYPFHGDRLSYWQDFLDEKKHKSQLGYAIKGLIKQTLLEQAREIEALKNENYEIKRLRELMKDKNLGIYALEDILNDGRKQITAELMRALKTVARFVNQGQLFL